MKVESWLIHNVAHFVVVYAIFQNAVLIFPSLGWVKLAVFIAAGGLLPDIDHFALIKNPYFKSFKDFLRWALKSDRHRIGFELFHNFLAVIILSLLTTFAFIFDVYIALFLFSFLLHLLTDILFDKMVIKSARHWRFSSRI